MKCFTPAFCGQHRPSDRRLFATTIAEILCRLGRAMIAMPSIAEIEVNPLVLRSDEPRVVAVDARVAVAHH